jgi:LmbE family N-acetylglucosaminyl deacetylase
MVAVASATAQTPIPTPAPWRDEASAVGTSTRVLIIGAHPDDEDNALIAWLSLGRHVETAYLSLTRGENGVNLMGREREILLGMVRTAELLAERKRDGAHQYFTRAYDFGHAKNDSVVWAGWPRDSVLRDVVTVMRAFRPHVVISLFSGDSTDRDGQHQAAGELARQGYMLAADTVRFPVRSSSGAGAWKIAALYQRVDSGGPSVVSINVGELDRIRKRSYAEIGGEIRLLQRTQAVRPAPPVGPTYRYLRRDSLQSFADRSDRESTAASSLFAGADTSWARFAALPLSGAIRADIASIVTATASMNEHAFTDTDDAAIARLATIVRAATRARDSLQCADGTDLLCRGLEGDLALSLAATRARAIRALLDANGIVIDATAERETIAAGDSGRVTVSVYNGGTQPLTITRVAVSGGNISGFADRNEVVVAPDSVARWTRSIRAFGATHPWWLANGLVSGTWIYDVGLKGATVHGRLVASEDRQQITSAEIALRVAGTEFSTTVGPIVARLDVALRGDERHPLVGVPRLSVLLERSREYARAAVPFERLYRVWVGSALARDDTVRVSLDLPAGLTTDSAVRSVVLPPFGGRNLFFRVRGKWPVGGFRLSARVTSMPARANSAAAPAVREFSMRDNVFDGLVEFEYPHIPTQWFPVLAADSVFAMDLRLPPTLRVAFIRANRNDQLDSRLSEMGVEVFPIDPLALAVADLSIYSTILIGPRAYAEVEALQVNASVVRRFAERGGTVVVLSGRDELLLPGVLPYPVTFSASAVDAVTALDPNAPVRILNPRSPLLDRPNRITPEDFEHWAGVRAREMPTTFDSHYQRVVAMTDDNDRPTDAGILAARVGKGMFIYTSLALDRQLVATNTGGARLLVNLLSASAKPGRSP